jgi:two-component system, OmpR family, sensor histidine kinase QseC
MATLIAASIGYWAVVVGIMVNHSVGEAYELFDSHLAQTALALLRVTDPDETDPVGIPKRSESPDIGEIFGEWHDFHQRLGQAGISTGVAASPPIDLSAEAESLHTLYDEYERLLRYQIWSGDGQLLLRSANAPTTAMADREGFSESTDSDGINWRHFGIWDQHRSFRVLVSEAHSVRNTLLRNIVLDLARPMVLGLPVLMFLLWYAIRRGLNPLRVVTEEIARKKVENLTPLDVGNSPEEIRPMALALNNLLHSVSRALENERCFTANAAHELRTPLAAIQAHLVAARGAASEGDREHSLDQLQRGLDRGIRLVGQLLTLARLDPEQALPDVEPVDAAHVIEAVCAELAPLALQRNQTLELTAESGLPQLPGNSGLLAMLFANLIDNAIRYTPDGGHIRIKVRAERSGLCIEVTDDGPGIPVSERERVFERFCRLADQTKPGTGLGLTICRRVAQLHNANVELADGQDGRGLTVRVLLPRNAP